MFRKAGILVGAVILMTGAVDDLQAQEFTLTASTDIVSTYVFRGFELADFAIQPGVQIGYGNAYAGVWHSKPLEDGVAITDETDFYAGYSFTVSGVSYDAGVTRYTYENSTSDTTEIYGGISLNNALSPSLYAYYDFDLDAFTVEGNVSKSLGPVSLGLTVGHVEFSGGNFTYGSANAQYNYSLTKKSSIYVNGNYGLTSNNSFDPATVGSSNFTQDNLFWGGVGFTISY